MKYIFFIFLSPFVILSCTNDPEPITLNENANILFGATINSQEDLDNIDFSLLDTIKGPLSITNIKETNLQFLGDLCITGTLEIRGNDDLVSLEGIQELSCLTSVIIRDNNNLRNIDALDNIEISNHLAIRNNGLEEVEPFESLAKVEGQIFVIEENLSDYRLLRNLTKVNSLILGGSLAENLDDLSQLQEIETELRITGNFNLSDYCGIKTALQNSGDITYETLGNQINLSKEEVIAICN